MDEDRVSPGLRRLRRHPEGEAIRRQVLVDQQEARSEAQERIKAMGVRKVRLTDSVLRGLKPSGQHVDRLQDTIAPTLRVRENMDGTFSFIRYGRFKKGGSMTRRTIPGGTVGRMPLAQVRVKVREWDEAAALGIDPKEVEDAAEAEKAGRTTLGAVLEKYFARYVRKLRTGRDIERRMRREWLSRFERRALVEMSTSEIAAVIGQIRDRGSPSEAHHVLGDIKAFFNWAIDQHEFKIHSSPCERLRPKRLIGEKKPRQRLLSDDEIRAFWAATQRMTYPYGDAYRLLMLTGCRKSEIGALRWREVDLDKALITIPPERFKSNTAHLVTLSTDALTLMKQLPRWSDGDDCVFSTRDGRQAVNGWSKAKDRLDRLMSETLGHDVEPWVVHDIRRVVRSGLASLKVSDTIAEMVLGHGRRGLQRVYDLHSYSSEMSDALELWARKLRDITQPPPENVLKLKVRA